MPKSKAIKVVPVDNNESLEVSQNDESIEQPSEEPISQQVTEQPEIKPKAKRQPRAKKVEPANDPIVNVISTLDESVADVSIPDDSIQDNKKQSNKVQCPDCNKMVTEKSLKYSHKYTCTAKKPLEQHNHAEVSQKEAQPEEIKEYEPVEVVLPAKPIKMESQREARNRIRQERIKMMFAKAV